MTRLMLMGLLRDMLPARRLRRRFGVSLAAAVDASRVGRFSRRLFRTSPASFEALIARRGTTDAAARRHAHEFIAAFLRDYRLPERPSTGAPFFVWIYWAQGFERAPPIVAACRRRMREMNPEAAIIERPIAI